MPTVVDLPNLKMLELCCADTDIASWLKLVPHVQHLYLRPINITALELAPLIPNVTSLYVEFVGDKTAEEKQELHSELLSSLPNLEHLRIE